VPGVKADGALRTKVAGNAPEASWPLSVSIEKTAAARVTLNTYVPSPLDTTRNVWVPTASSQTGELKSVEVNVTESAASRVAEVVLPPTKETATLRPVNWNPKDAL
jgi:hypothetical protein